MEDFPHNIIQSIIKGEYIMENMFDEMLQDLIDMDGVAYVLEHADNHLQRVDAVEKNIDMEDFSAYMRFLDTRMIKNDNVAARLKIEGDTYHYNSRLTKSLRCFNLAACFAAPDGLLIGVIYASRSELLLAMNEPEAALRDIQEAMLCRIRTETRLQLEQRQKDCALAIKRRPRVVLTKEKRRRRMYSEELYPKPPNPKIPSAGEYLSIEKGSEKGRHVITNKLLAPGTPAILDPYYVRTLDSTLRWGLSHCSFCFIRIRATYPCANCIFVVYCGEECREKDRETHKYECACLPFCHGVVMGINMRLGLKALCRAGPETLYKIFQDPSILNMNDKGITVGEGHKDEPDYRSDCYYQICNLVSYIDPRKMPEEACLAYSLARILQTHTRFYIQVPPNESSKFRLFIASMLLRHFTSFPANSVALDGGNNLGKFTNPSQSDAEESGYIGVVIGTAVFPFISLVSHSCAPNTSAVFTRDGKMMLMVNRQIYPGEEITMTYGYSFLDDNFELRQDKLSRTYRFICDCIACTDKWPMVADIDLEKKFICQDCRSQNFTITNTQSGLGALVPNGNGTATCDKCKTTVSLLNIREKCHEFVVKYSKVRKMIRKNKILEAVPELTECIEYFQRNVFSPTTEQTACEDELQHIYERITRG